MHGNVNRAPGSRSVLFIVVALSPRKPFEWIFALGWWGYFKKVSCSDVTLTRLPPLMVWSLVGVAPHRASRRAGHSPERTQRLPRPRGGRHPMAPRRRSSLLPNM